MSAGGCLDAGRFDSDASANENRPARHITVLQTWDANIRRPQKGGLLIFL